MQWDPALPKSLVEKLWHNPDALLKQNTLQDKLRCTVARIDDAAGAFTLKRHNWGSIGRTIRRSLSRSTARKSWLDARYLCQAGVPTPQPRAFLERRVGPFKSQSYLLTDYVPGTSLYRFMRFGSPSQQAVQALARQAAAIWQQLVDLRIQHNDFQTENLLVDPQGKLWLIDLERLRPHKRGERAIRQQLVDLEYLLHPRNWRAMPQAAELFRQEVLKTTAGARIFATVSGEDHPLKQPLPLENRASQLVTVLIPCLNAEATILKCLRSVHDIADEILVADAGSTDETLKLVREFGGCKIIEGPRLDDASFATWASPHASHTWILRIQPDEQLSPELARELQYKLATEPQDDAFEVLHAVSFRGRWLQHGGFQNAASIRLYRKEVNQHLIRDGHTVVNTESKRIGKIPFSITCELCPRIEQHIASAMRRATDAAQAIPIARRTPTSGTALFDATCQLLKSLILQSSWLDGWAGIHASYLSALDVYLRETVLWEMQQSTQHPASNSSMVWQELKFFESERAPKSNFAA